MKNLINENWKTIILFILSIIFIYLLIRVFTPIKTNSELNKYKLEKIDEKINNIENLQKNLKDSINFYQEKIKSIDNKISNIKLERNQINNYYTIKEQEIINSDRKKIDSLLKDRYKY